MLTSLCEGGRSNRRVVKQGHNSWVAKVDVESAYRIVPVHPQDWWLLGMQWNGALFEDKHCHLG